MIKFRKAKEIEIEEIFSIVKEIKKTSKVWDEEYPLIENFIESFDEGGLYVLVNDSDIIGSICVYKSETTMDCVGLARFLVNPKYQRQGYGRMIFEKIEAILKKEYKYIELYVDEVHPYAFLMYEKFGYTDLGERKTPWKEENKYHYLIKELQ